MTICQNTTMWTQPLKEAESIINNLIRQHSTQMSSLVNSIKHWRKKSHQFSTISFSAQYTRKCFLTHYTKPDKDITKLQTNISHEHRCKTCQQNISELNPWCVKRLKLYDQIGFISSTQGLFNIWKSMNVIHHINRPTWSYQ